MQERPASARTVPRRLPGASGRAWAAENHAGPRGALDAGSANAALVILPVGDPRVPAVAPDPPEPAGLSEAARERHRLADELVRVLTGHVMGDARGEDWLSSLSLPATVRYLPDVQRALLAAPEAAERAEPGAALVAAGIGGVAVRLHGPDWTMIFRVSPTVEPVLIITDEEPDVARRIDTDPDWLPEIDTAVSAIVRELSRRSLAGDG